MLKTPSSSFFKKIIIFFSIFWAFFQLWIASPLPYILSDLLNINLVLSDSQSRIIHLSIAILLSYLVDNNGKCKYFYYLIGFIGFGAVLHNFIFYEQIALNAGIVSNSEVIISCIGIGILAWATKRNIGFPIVIIAGIFLLYSIFGNHLPIIVSHKGHSLSQISYQQWLSSEGIFGVALGVSSDFIYMFVLFGALLEASGASNFFIKLAFAGLGKLRNGAAKATIVGSALMGMISGSSVATTITVGTVTIPLMKKAGLSAEKAGGVQIAAGVNGQITPPIMGAAAFLMAEFLSIKYSDIIRYALLPSIIIYFSLFYSVHLEKTDDFHEENRDHSLMNMLCKFAKLIFKFTIFAVGSFFSVAAFYYLMCGISTKSGLHIRGIQNIFGDNMWGSTLFLVGSYFGVIYMQFKCVYQDVKKIHEFNDPVDNIKEYIASAQPLKILIGGLHYLMPVFLLLWLLTVEKMSSAICVFWATMSLIVIIFTHNNILYILHGKSSFSYLKNEFKEDVMHIIDAMKSSSHSMIGIALATAVSGIIIGSIAQTGISQAFVDILETLARDNILLILITTAIICVILGMGMPTTACYMIVSSLMVPVIFEITQNKGMSVAPVALHFFVFYFGLMADITPPVGLASYAAAAISKGNPIKTAAQGLLYNKNLILLPFVFVYNNDLIFYKVTDWSQIILTSLCAIFASVAFVSALKGRFLTKNKIYESIALIVICIGFFNPNLVVNLFQNPYQKISIHEFEKDFANFNDVEKTKLLLINDKKDSKIAYVDVRSGEKNMKENFEKSLDLVFYSVDGKIELAKVMDYNKNNFKLIDLMNDDYKISQIELPIVKFDRKIVLLAGIGFFMLIFLNQHMRKCREEKLSC